MAASRTALALTVVLLGLQLAGVAQADAVTAAPPLDEAYLVQPGDTLQVTVWKETELQGEVLVRPDGGLSFPLAGEIEAAGHTVDEIRKTLQNRLAKYLPDPVVTVAVKAAAGSRIFVVGKVNRPGDFLLNRPIDAMSKMMSEAGYRNNLRDSARRLSRRESLC